jgi:tRNA-dihydrouridine synthase B
MLSNKNLFGPELQNKINKFKHAWSPFPVAGITVANPFGLAPMSAISTAPFRLLMEQLGAGFTVSELISCDGINHGNARTRRMLTIDPREKNVGIQLFGDDADAMARAAQVAQEHEPKFVDINMGCPVRKVVTKGSGSALMKEPLKAAQMFAAMKKVLQVPLTIKIRTGWDENNRNAREIVHIAKEEGVAWVAIHGRTRTQQYKGQADWNYLNWIASDSPLPILGNGDLHSARATRQRWQETSCQALLLGRGPLRDPFIFLKSLATEEQIASGEANFSPADYFEVIAAYRELLESYAQRPREMEIQLKKHIVWICSGLENAAAFRQLIFAQQTTAEIMKYTEDFFLSQTKVIGREQDFDQGFMAGGHG